MGVKCTASGQMRSWDKEAWINGRGLCPDCGWATGVWVRGGDLFPRGKARPHDAPEDVTPAPYGVDGYAGHPLPRDTKMAAWAVLAHGEVVGVYLSEQTAENVRINEGAGATVEKVTMR